MADQDPAYIGVRPCGCVTFVMVIGSEPPAREATEIARVIKSGRRIEQVTVAEARSRFTDCECAAKAPDPAQVTLDV